DRNVTGVQTCALPIWFLRLGVGVRRRVVRVRIEPLSRPVRPCDEFAFELEVVLPLTVVSAQQVPEGPGEACGDGVLDAHVQVDRSEERRGGKEGRSRW